MKSGSKSRTREKSKKTLYEIRIRGQAPDDLVKKVSELHAEVILLSGTSISKKQDAITVPGDERAQKLLAAEASKKSVLNSEESRE